MGNHSEAKGQQLGQGRGARRDAGRLARRTPSGDARAECESLHEHTKAGRPGGVQEPDTGIPKYLAEPGPCDRGPDRPAPPAAAPTPAAGRQGQGGAPTASNPSPRREGGDSQQHPAVSPLAPVGLEGGQTELKIT